MASVRGRDRAPAKLGAPQLSLDDLGTPLPREVTFVVLDLETTGGRAAADSITEVGAVKVRGGEQIGELATLVDPGTGIPRHGGARPAGGCRCRVHQRGQLADLLPAAHLDRSTSVIESAAARPPCPRSSTTKTASRSECPSSSRPLRRPSFGRRRRTHGHRRWPRPPTFPGDEAQL